MTAGQSQVISQTSQNLKWDLFLYDTLRFANYQVNRLRWRHHEQGVLPEGFDPAGLAAQALFEFLQAHPIFNPVAFPSDSSESTLLSSLDSESCRRIQYELNRLVLKQVNRLYHLKENFVVDPVDELVPVEDMDSEFVNPIEFIPSSDLRPDEALLKKESLVESEQIKQAFESFLSNRPLKKVFRLAYDGIVKPADIAERMNLPVRTVYNLRAQLQRVWSRFVHDVQN